MTIEAEGDEIAQVELWPALRNGYDVVDFEIYWIFYFEAPYKFPPKSRLFRDGLRQPEIGSPGKPEDCRGVVGAEAAILACVGVTRQNPLTDLGPVLDGFLDEFPFTVVIADHEAVWYFLSEIPLLGEDKPDREAYLLPTPEAKAVKGISGSIIL
jgi:hypothetical protein